MFFKKSDDKKSLIGVIRGAGIGLSLVFLAIASLLLFPQTREFLDDKFKRGTFQTIDFESFKPSEDEEGYLVCPVDTCIDITPDQLAPEFNVSASQLRTILFEYIDSQGSISLQNLDMQNQKFDFIEKTPSMRLPDIITVQIIELSPTKSTIALYSRAMNGYENKERNKTRVTRWLQFIRP